jgi:hypothetical protein
MGRANKAITVTAIHVLVDQGPPVNNEMMVEVEVTINTDVTNAIAALSRHGENVMMLLLPVINPYGVLLSKVGELNYS